MYWPPLTISIAVCPGTAIEPPAPPLPAAPPAPPAPPTPPEPALPELELELVLELDEDISPELVLPDELPVVDTGGTSSLQEAAIAGSSNAIKNTAAGLVLIIHRLAVRATRVRSEQRLFLENKCEFFVMVLLGRTPSPTRFVLLVVATYAPNVRPQHEIALDHRHAMTLRQS